MKRALRIAGRIYLAGVILIGLILVLFHNRILGTEHLELQHLVIAVFWPVVVVVLVLGALGIVNLSD